MKPERRAIWADRAVSLIALALGVAFLIAFAARPAVVIPGAGLDDALFVRLGRYLAMGDWLGPYDQRTLVKGMGFPAFLALANLLGLAYPLAIALIHLASSGFAAVVSGRLLRSRLAGLSLFALLLLIPPLYYGDQLRASREAFYTALTLALAASAIALGSGRIMPRAWSIPLTGLLGAWWWLTREEGVWLLPSLALLALLPLAEAGPASLRARAARLAPAAGALAIAAALVVGVGLANRDAYGRFTINEIKDSAFQGAISALQKAGEPYHRDRVPVPAAARRAIYAVSPSFAALAPVLDGPQGEGWRAHGCRMDAGLCGDIGGGWFFWAVRDAAAAHGDHQSPQKAAAFYRRITAEVTEACETGRLRCARWGVPLIPPTRPDQAGDVAKSLGRAIGVMSFTQPVVPDAAASDISVEGGADMSVFLGSPRIVSPIQQRAISGWYVAQDDAWFEPVPVQGVAVRRFLRQDSLDLVDHFANPALGRQRFVLEADCPARAPCLITLATPGRAAQQIDLAALARGPYAVGGAQMFVEAAAEPGAEPYLKLRFSDQWSKAAARLNPLYMALTVAGLAAYAALCVIAVRRRILFPTLIICTALIGGVAARAIILALIDALSFPAIDAGYALPAAPLLVVFAIFALSGLLQQFKRQTSS